MLQSFTTFAEAEKSSNLFTALGIDWQMLLFQGIAFLVLVVVLAKFVFPILFKAVDDRQEKIEESTKAAADAEKKAEAAEAKIEDVLKQARTEAADIVSTAKDEATQMVETAESNAKKRADRIVEEAQESLEKDVLAARETLKKDTLKLVKEAASIATAGVADSKLDTALIKKSLDGAKK